MKKILASVLALALVLSTLMLAGCGGNTETTDTSKKPTESTSATTDTTADKGGNDDGTTNGNNDGTAAENVRKGQVEILLQQVQVLYNKYGNLPTVVTGDFNTQPNTVSYNAMLAGGFVDSSKVAVEADDKRTFNGNGFVHKSTA